MIFRYLVFCIFFFKSAVFAGVVCNKQLTIASTDGGIFSLESYNDCLVIGAFGYDYSLFTNDDVMIYLYCDGLLISSDLTKSRLGDSESICVLKEWNGELFAFTERAGKGFKSKNGVNWTEIDTKGSRDGCDLTVGQDNQGTQILLAPQTHNGNYIYTYDGDNWIKGGVSGSSNSYLRTSSYLDKWYLWGIDRTTHQRKSFKSLNLNSWTGFDFNHRVFASQVYEDKLWLSIAGVPYYPGSNKISIYTFDGSEFDPIYIHPNNEYSHLSDIYRVIIDGEIKHVALASTGFKPKESPFGSLGDSALLQFSKHGILEDVLCNFVGQEYADATAWHNGHLWVGTMHDGYETGNKGFGNGDLYKITGVKRYSPGRSIIPIINLLLN